MKVEGVSGNTIKLARLEVTVTRSTSFAIALMEGRKEPCGGRFSEGRGTLEAGPMVLHSETDLPLIVNADLSVGVPRDE